jgi:hypothetical protein
MKNTITATNRNIIHILYQEVRRSRRFDEASASDDMVFSALQPATCTAGQWLSAKFWPKITVVGFRLRLETLAFRAATELFVPALPLCTTTMLDFHFSLHRPSHGRFGSERIYLIAPVLPHAIGVFLSLYIHVWRKRQEGYIEQTLDHDTPSILLIYIQGRRLV